MNQFKTNSHNDALSFKIHHCITINYTWTHIFHLHIRNYFLPLNLIGKKKLETHNYSSNIITVQVTDLTKIQNRPNLLSFFDVIIWKYKCSFSQTDKLMQNKGSNILTKSYHLLTPKGQQRVKQIRSINPTFLWYYLQKQCPLFILSFFFFCRIFAAAKYTCVSSCTILQQWGVQGKLWGTMQNWSWS